MDNSEKLSLFGKSTNKGSGFIDIQSHEYSSVNLELSGSMVNDFFINPSISLNSKLTGAGITGGYSWVEYQNSGGTTIHSPIGVDASGWLQAMRDRYGVGF